MSHKYIDIFKDAAKESLEQDFYDKHGRDMTEAESKIFLTDEAIWNRAESFSNDFQQEGLDGEWEHA